MKVIDFITNFMKRKDIKTKTYIHKDIDPETKTAYGKIYRNGVALGAEQTEAGLAYITKSQDITQDWQPGDTVELYIHNTNIATTSIQNFQIAYDDSPTVSVSSSNS